MTKCPYCNTEGADVFLRTVFCPNRECAHFSEDQVATPPLEPKASTNPDITPNWNPQFDLDFHNDFIEEMD